MNKYSGQPISRVLYWQHYSLRTMYFILQPKPVAIIYLELTLLWASCGPPETQMWRVTTSFLLGLAPREGCLDSYITADAGVLLPHHFTLAHKPNHGQYFSLW